MSILVFPDDRLRQRSGPMPKGTPLREVLDALWNTLKKTNGLGLSAIQIGLPYNIFLMHDWAHAPEFIVDPSFTVPEGVFHQSVQEGCLSFPGVFEAVLRYPEIKASYIRVDPSNLYAYPEHRILSGVQAQIYQHESEHLEGKLLIDNVRPERVKAITNKLKKWKAKGIVYP